MLHIIFSTMMKIPVMICPMIHTSSTLTGLI